MTHWMHWVWLVGGIYVLVAQALGMTVGDGWGLSRVMDRVLGFHWATSALLGAFWLWLPVHFLVGRTSTAFGGAYEIGSWIVGAGLGLLAWRTREKRQDSTGPDGP